MFAAQEIILIRIKNRLNEISYQSSVKTTSVSSRPKEYRQPTGSQSQRIHELASQLGNHEEDEAWQRLEKLVDGDKSQPNEQVNVEVDVRKLSSDDSDSDGDLKDRVELPRNELDSIEEMLSQLTMTPYASVVSCTNNVIADVREHPAVENNRVK